MLISPLAALIFPPSLSALPSSHALSHIVNSSGLLFLGILGGYSLRAGRRQRSQGGSSESGSREMITWSYRLVITRFGCTNGIAVRGMCAIAVPPSCGRVLSLRHCRISFAPGTCIWGLEFLERPQIAATFPPHKALRCDCASEVSSSYKVFL